VYVIFKTSELTTDAFEENAAVDHNVPVLPDFVGLEVMKIPRIVAVALIVKSTVELLVIARLAAVPAVHSGLVASE
jgi:hypothetical protein